MPVEVGNEGNSNKQILMTRSVACCGLRETDISLIARCDLDAIRYSSSRNAKSYRGALKISETELDVFVSPWPPYIAGGKRRYV
jgi:hypothetical protein